MVNFWFSTKISCKWISKTCSKMLNDKLSFKTLLFCTQVAPNMFLPKFALTQVSNFLPIISRKVECTSDFVAVCMC